MGGPEAGEMGWVGDGFSGTAAGGYDILELCRTAQQAHPSAREDAGIGADSPLYRKCDFSRNGLAIASLASLCVCVWLSRRRKKMGLYSEVVMLKWG